MSSLEKKLRKYLNGPTKTVAYLATVDVNAGYTPEIRPISLMEYDWCFYMATTINSRKAQEMSKFPKAAILIHLRDNNYSGYLRMTGKVESVENMKTRTQVAEATKYPLESRFGGASNPNLFFAKITPERIEFMEPGEDVASDITHNFFELNKRVDTP